MYLNQYWKDERLAFSSSDELLTLPGDFAEKIWVPDTFFANDKSSYLHDVTEKNKMVRLHGDGSITYGMRFTTTLACMMDLHYYPLDTQNCTVEIESCKLENVAVVNFLPKILVGTVPWTTWSCTGRRCPWWAWRRPSCRSSPSRATRPNDRTESLATGVYRRLSISFNLTRNIGYFVFQTYLPSILIVMLSWVSFWINHEATSARVALGITTVLTMTTISTGVRSSLPRISYVKAIDIYLVMCFVFVFAALLEYAAVNYTYWGQRAKKKAKKMKESNGQQNKQSPAIKEDGVSTNEEIIELQDIRMSPIPSIRQRHNSKFFPSEGSMQDLKFPPSFRINRNYSFPTRSSVHTPRAPNRKRVISTLKKGASVLKSAIPTIKDVNIIDKYSRVVFPLSFVFFNTVYWCFYVL
ncbi:Gamma-aminobutyric acid receptor subunit beta-like [Chionoecetes opilio]|uniref:Gamma-aminobutyric acid receptor subunit beta-like n=1 Tax=Chionoecetes opilio TaxID=41210 RepID=A0A8J5CZY4_CHIOP|nr:Gamma-aminobutyric acid receptor subunit beta-like [Chionoecetes opilio]